MDRPALQVTELAPLLLDGGARARMAGASGIVRVGGWLHGVADDDEFLRSWRLPIVDRSISTRISPGDLPTEHAARKAAKRDVEALMLLRSEGRDMLVGLGSGSTSRRCAGFVVLLDDDGRIDGDATSFELAGLYAALTDGGSPPNVEGAAQLGEELVLLLRSSTGANRVARLRADRFMRGMRAGTVAADSIASVTTCELGVLRGIPLGFTDAAVVEGRVWFSAAAEDTANAYDDGAVAGSVIGRLDPDFATAEAWELALPGGKVEGVAPVTLASGEPGFWLVTDGDDAARPSLLLECSIPLT